MPQLRAHPQWDWEASVRPFLSLLPRHQNPVLLQLSPDARKYRGCTAGVKTHGQGENPSPLQFHYYHPRKLADGEGDRRPASGRPCAGDAQTSQEPSSCPVSCRRPRGGTPGGLEAGPGEHRGPSAPLPLGPVSPCLPKKLKIPDPRPDSDTHWLCDPH